MMIFETADGVVVRKTSRACVARGWITTTGEFCMALQMVSTLFRKRFAKLSAVCLDVDDGWRGSSRPLTFDQSTLELLRLLVIALVQYSRYSPTCSSAGTSAGFTKRPAQLAYGVYNKIARAAGYWLWRWRNQHRIMELSVANGWLPWPVARACQRRTSASGRSTRAMTWRHSAGPWSVSNAIGRRWSCRGWNHATGDVQWFLLLVCRRRTGDQAWTRWTSGESRRASVP